MTSVFNPRRIGHVNLIVSGLERSTQFYGSVCGLALEFAETGLRGSFMGSGNTHHDLGMIEQTLEDRYGKDGHLQIPKEAASQVRLNHIAWEMDTERDLVESIARAASAGVPIARIVDHQISHSVYLKDPDGNTVEFYSDVIRDWRSVLHGEVDHITSVWTPDLATAGTEPLRDPAPAPRRVEGATFHPQRLCHAVLETVDLDRMTTFYADVAGLEVVYRDGFLSLLRAPGAPDAYNLALVQSAARSAFHHFGFELAPDASLDASRQAARAAGQGAVWQVNGPVKEGVFVADPDGFLVEFFRPGTRQGAASYALVAKAEPSERAFLV